MRAVDPLLRNMKRASAAGQSLFAKKMNKVASPWEKERRREARMTAETVRLADAAETRKRELIERRRNPRLIVLPRPNGVSLAELDRRAAAAPVAQPLHQPPKAAHRPRHVRTDSFDRQFVWQDGHLHLREDLCD